MRRSREQPVAESLEPRIPLDESVRFARAGVWTLLGEQPVAEIFGMRTRLGEIVASARKSVWARVSGERTIAALSSPGRTHRRSTRGRARLSSTVAPAGSATDCRA